MTSRREIEEQGYLSTPRVDPSALQLLWHVDYYDGPKSGVLDYQGEECWFEVVEENEDDGETWYRRFIIVRLTPEQMAEERKWHQLFRERVGTHTDYGEQGAGDVGVRPRASWQEFYDAYKTRVVPDYSENEVLGWFER